MLNFIKCHTKEDCGSIVHIVTWTTEKTMSNGFSQKVYPNAFYGPKEAIQDAAKRLGVNVGPITYGLNGYSNATILEG